MPAPPELQDCEISSNVHELMRIRAVYHEREAARVQQQYLRTNPCHLWRLQEKEDAMARLFCCAGLRTLAGLRILDVGCGRGATLRQFLEYGADPDLLWGIDLMEEYTRESRRLAPHLKVVCGSAGDLPFADASFQLACQSMLFTSVLHDELKRRIAREIQRVLAPGGKFLWYDFLYDNPSNRDVRGVKLGEMKRLFPGFRMRLQRVTVAPPLARILRPLGAAVYHLAARTRVLCTHYLALMEKP